MFGLFKPKPPLGPWEKAWTEHRFSWFTDQLGLACVLEIETLSPDDQRIPAFDHRDDLPNLLEFLGSWMRFDTSRVSTHVFGETIAPDQLRRIDEDGVSLRIHESLLGNREHLVASLAWQLAHQMITNGPFLDPKRADLEWTTDLLPAFLGLGIFAANTRLREPQPEANHFAWWGKRQRAYLPSRIFGYAMALRAHVRGETSNGWAVALRPDAQIALGDGRKYLEKTDDTTFSRTSAQQDPSRLAAEAFVEDLSRGSPSRQISAMWEISTRSTELTDSLKRQVAELLRDCLRHKEPEVRAVSASTLPLFDLSADAAQDLADALRDSSDEVRISAGGALGAFVGVDDDTLVSDLTEALKDSERLVVFNAARSLTRYGVPARSALQQLLKRMRQALVECRDADALLLLATIDAIAENGKQLVAEHFGESDAEYQGMAMDLWEQLEATTQKI